MITIISINKQGNKIISYTCANGSETKNLAKEQVSKLIDKKQVSNATKQVYKGNTIIRVKGINATHHSSKQAEEKSKPQIQSKPDTSRQEKLVQIQVIMGNAKKMNIDKNNYVMVSKIGDTNIIYIPEQFKTEKNFDWHSHEDWVQIITQNIKKLKIIGGKNITSTSGMFSDCQAQSIDLSSFNTSKVTDMWNMFFDCEAQSIDLSSFNTSKVTDMRHMFYNCKAKVITADKRIMQAYSNK